MKKPIKPFLYGLGVFSIYIVLTLTLRLITGKLPDVPDYFGIFTTNDLLLGLVVALVLTISNEKKKKLRD